MSVSKSRAAGRGALGLVVLALAAGASRAQDEGFRGGSYAGANSFPTAAKPQSKLWWNDGAWWGCLWSAASSSFTIQRLDASDTWVDTGTAVDFRPKSHADCLWDGAKLYIASNQYTVGAGNPGHPLEVYRYSYEPSSATYALDVGFPVEIGGTSTEVLVIDEDSLGTLWAVWTAGNRVWFTHTLEDDRSWSVPARHPALTTDLSGDDICSIVRFQGDKIGLLWSDQVSQSFRFTFHVAGDPATLWSPVETVLSAPSIADDHISLKASADGRVFAALKTSSDQVLLAERAAAGGWSGVQVTAAADGWTRPILVLDEQHRIAHVFGTSPVILGTIYEKTADMDALGFAPGRGLPVLRDASGPAFNDATSSKQSVDGATGLVVLASDQVREQYGHHHDALGGPVPVRPRAALAAETRQGFEPMSVQFLDASSGEPTQWSWSFGDGASASVQHPLHTYAHAGRYTVTLEVTNALGTDSVTRTDLIDVELPPDTLVLHPLADAQVHLTAPDSNYAALSTLRVRDGADAFHSYLKFFVPPSSGRITSAVLRLHCLDGSPDGGALFRVANAWDEPTLSWNRAPALDGAPLGVLGAVLSATTVQQDLGASVSASGTLSLGLASASTNSAYYSSREGANPPELVIGLETASSTPPVAGFEAPRTTAIRPFLVQFDDTSNGTVLSWSWDFGDGASSSLQNPSHLYPHPGIYTVSLTCSNAYGSDTLTRADYVHVLAVGKDLRSGARTPPFLPHSFVPFRAGAPGAQTRAARLEFTLAAALDDEALDGALEWLAEQLPAAALEFPPRVLERDRAGALSALALRVRWAEREGLLLLRARATNETEGVLTLPLD